MSERLMSLHGTAAIPKDAATALWGALRNPHMLQPRLLRLPAFTSAGCCCLQPAVAACCLTWQPSRKIIKLGKMQDAVL